MRMKSGFLASRRGNVSLLFAFLTVPLLGVTGMALDYGQAITLKKQIAAAVDSAALGAIAEKSPGAAVAATMTGDGPIPEAEKDARRLIMANLPQSLAANAVNFDIAVTKSGNNLKSEITFTGQSETTISRMFGKQQFPITGAASAEHRIANYMDFFILIDNTPSMGVAATTGDIAKMESKTGGCAFACHQMDSASNDNYSVARKNGVTLRIDVVRQATQSLTTTATQSQAVADQFRMGVYTFGDKAETAKLTTITAPTNDLNKVSTLANAVDLMTIPYNGYGGDALTDYDGAMTSINKLIDAAGDGSGTANRQKILFLVADGVGDSPKGIRCTKNTTGSRCQEPLDVSICKPLKDRGVKIAVLYTTYLPLPSNGWYNQWIKPFQSQIPTNMETCASPGLYYEVGPNEGIVEAMNALFIKAMRTVRLSS